MEKLIISKDLEEKIKSAGSLEEVVGFCAAEGIDVTKEQLEAAMLPETDGELTEQMLDAVSGGIWHTIAKAIASLFTSRQSNFSTCGGCGGGAGGTGGR